MNQNTKWTPDQDKRLFNAVHKHGTQWNIVIKQLGNTRSQNAIIKRWHGYLKQRRFEENDKQSEKQEPAPQINQDQQNQDDKEESSIDQLKIQKQNHEIIKKIQTTDMQWTHNWTEQDDSRLKKFILFDFIFYWDKLSDHFGVNDDEVRGRWIKVIYPKLKNTLKIGGAVKWSSSQDSILFGADKNKVSYMNLMFFLPGRTVYSIEARWRRIVKNSDVIDHMAMLNEKSNKRKDLLAQISKKIKMKKQAKMDCIFDIERINFEKKKVQLSKYQVMKRSEKARKQYKT